MIFTNYIKDPIYNEINFKHASWALSLVNSFEFKRLQNIYQLGISYKVFPSATNTRFLHSIGTFEVASKFAYHFKEKYNINQKEINIFLCTALLHDIGHGPFSHVFEKITKINHEEITQKIILGNSEINKILMDEKINPQDIVDVLKGKYKKLWINKFISSNLDVDRIDYMLRDSYFLGTHYSTIDLNFLIERTYIVNDDIVFSEKALNIIESFLLGRFYMHNDIYDNKNTYIYEWALESIFIRLKEIKKLFKKNKEKIYYYDFYEWIIFNKKIDINNYLKLNDFNLTTFIDSLKFLNDEILNSFIDFFLNGEGLYSVSFSSNEAKKILIKIKNSKLDKKYLSFELVKKNKLFYMSEMKAEIKILNENTKKVKKFPYTDLLDFTSKKTNNNEKILLYNNKLIF